MDALPSRPHPSNNNLFPSRLRLAPAWLLLFLIWLPHCSSRLSDKGDPCSTSETCNTGLKCIQAHCSDGRDGSVCDSSVDCLSTYTCINQRCTLRGEATEDGGENPDESPEAPESSNETISEEEPLDLSLPDGIVEQCRSYKDCGEQTCLVQKDGRSLLCGDLIRSCQSQLDCKSLEGTACQLHPQPRDGALGLYCVYPRSTSQPRKTLGSPCTQNGNCLSNICLPTTQECGTFCRKGKDGEADEGCPEGFYCAAYPFFQTPTDSVFGCYRNCQEDKDCPASYACTDSQCVPDGTPAIGGACQSQEHCPNQAQCFDAWSGGYCLQDCSTSASCPTGSVCTPFSSGLSFCLKQCSEASDCRKEYFCGASGTPGKSVCLPQGKRELGNLCETDMDCQTGQCRQLPTGRQCTRSCSEANQCPLRFVCQSMEGESFCSKQCSVNEDCPENYECKEGACLIPSSTKDRDLGSACTQDSHCRTSLFCLTSEPQLPYGYCTQRCDSQTPCPQGSYCAQLGNQTICLQTCNPASNRCDPSSSSCNNVVDLCRKNYYCSSQVIRLSPNNEPLACSEQKPCPTSSIPWVCDLHWTSQVCSLGLCLARGVRANGQTCFRHNECASGTCYLPTPTTTSQPCTADKDCTGSTAGPWCEPQEKRCVACLSSKDCPFPQQCIQNACLSGGYCITPCRSEGEACSQSSQCKGLNNKQGTSMGKYCLPTCTSSLECLESFVCRPTKPSNVCQLP
ncbi:MAG: hypothetical protein EP343_17625 [Deltaproteobacteria bacterium]|nr:MAG: hypothetical protein EP343_17625 [Deltaproteobacteria bacterium]